LEKIDRKELNRWRSINWQKLSLWVWCTTSLGHRVYIQVAL